MNFIHKISVLNSIIDKLQLPENHLLLIYRRDSFDYQEEGIKIAFFYQNYFKLLQRYFYQSFSYSELILFMNVEGEEAVDLRNNVWQNHNMLNADNYIDAEIQNKTIEIKALIKKLKNAGVHIEEIEANFNAFERGAIHHTEIFQLHFLEITQAELALQSPAHEASIFSLITACLLYILNYNCVNAQKISPEGFGDSNIPDNYESRFDQDPDIGGQDSSFINFFQARAKRNSHQKYAKN